MSEWIETGICRADSADTFPVSTVPAWGQIQRLDEMRCLVVCIAGKGIFEDHKESIWIQQ
jgi:hypothetical protein